MQREQNQIQDQHQELEHEQDAPETRDVARLRADTLAGRLSRRGVLKRAIALGLSAPVIAALLAACGGDDDDTSDPGAGTTGDATETDSSGSELPTGEGGGEPEPAAERARGAGDLLRLLYWQAPTILNPHFAQGDKDTHPARLVLEPLANVASDGTLHPVLAAEIPSVENGGVAADGLSVTWKLREGVLWSDGTPFTAEDVKFTWEFATNPEIAATTFATYAIIDAVEVVDDLTVRLVFAEPNPAWHTAFSGSFNGMILPRHLLADAAAADARSAGFNLKPIGTGPYMVREFLPGDTVLYDLNENYREADKPFFQSIELKGGGDATSSARAVLQTAEADYAWNLQVEKQVLEQLSNDGDAGTVVAVLGNSVEQVLINFADPNTEVDGARSEPSTEHPFFSDKRVREALRLASDSTTIATQLYGDAGVPASNTLVSPERFNSPNTAVEFDLDAASALLDEAGWTLDGNVRRKDGKELSIVFTTTTSPIRQKTQEILKQSWQKIGVKVELKTVDSSVYFSSDAGNPDTVSHFYADVTMYTNGPISPYPLDYMTAFKSTDPAADIAQKANSWSGNNYARWVNEEFNDLWQQAKVELDLDRQAELFIAMNDLVVNEVVRIPLVQRAIPGGFANRLKGNTPSSWEAAVYDIANWYFED